ncbi:MAG: YggS family pyridoxal phosphate-dependent enzyme [Anaerolineae bacterium]|nr:YggS family pyridoxal phosphate-dependent enzyme [Anaerolineae bacterium]
MTIVTNLENIRTRIAEAASRVGRNPSDVQLVAVTKTFPVDDILAAWDSGQRDFGENRPEEGAQKISEVASRLPAESEKPTWHMIGHIQRRKAPLVVVHFDVVHSIDRLAVAQKLSVLAVDAERELPVLLECNVSGEASKYGYQTAGWEHDLALREHLYAEVAAIMALPGLRLEGLMTMAPIVDDAEAVRPVFASLRALRDALREHFPSVTLPHLSMGMTNDFEIAVEEGATLIRVGRGIFLSTD